MRTTKEAGSFHDRLGTVCYILKHSNGALEQLSHDSAELRRGYEAAIAGDAEIYAVWPGNWRSDLFIVDDLNEFAEALNLIPSSHIHDVEWQLDSSDDGSSRYASVRCRLKCGCDLHKLGIARFSDDMREQRGWDVVRSRGLSGSSESYYIRVVRRTLK